MSFVPSFSGHVQIYYGPPGTGKTEQFMRDLEKELEHTPPERIMYTSFTREGAYQGVKRALKKFPQYSIKQFPYFRTLHSIAFHELGLTKDRIISRAHYREFSRLIGLNFAGYFMKDARSMDDKYMFFADVIRNNRELAAQLFQDLDPFKAKYVLLQYKAYKEQMKLMDFTDILTQYVAKQESLPVDVAFIDEGQDLTTLQWRAIDLSCRGCKRLYIAGDDDQAIYQWAGADVGIFLSLEGDKKVLGTSHRFGEGIRTFASNITQNIHERIPKEYHGKDMSGNVQRVAGFTDVPMDNEGSYLFLFRNTRFIALGEELMMARGLLYQTEDGLSVSPADLDAVKGWEEYLKTGSVNGTQKLRIQNASGAEPDKMEKKSWKDVFVKWSYEKCDYLEKIAAKYDTVTGIIPKYTLRTIHTVKGAEADNVVLYTGMSRLTYEAFEEEPDAEHRVWYVAVTRARNNLYLVSSDEDDNYPLFFK